MQDTWKPAKASDLRIGREVRIQRNDGTSFVARVSHKGRGWSATLRTADGGTFVVSSLYSDFGTYRVEVQ